MGTFRTSIPGVDAAATTDLPVLLPSVPEPAGQAQDLRFSRWIGSLSPRFLLLLLGAAGLWPLMAYAQSMQWLSTRKTRSLEKKDAL